LEGRNRGLVAYNSAIFPEGVRKFTKILVRIAGVPTGIGIEYLLNTNCFTVRPAFSSYFVPKLKYSVSISYLDTNKFLLIRFGMDHAI
jgi:hypothetical protein